MSDDNYDEVIKFIKENDGPLFVTRTHPDVEKFIEDSTMEHNQNLVNFGIIDKMEEEKINLDYQSILKAFEERAKDIIQSIKSDNLTLMKLYQLKEDLQTMIALQKLKGCDRPIYSEEGLASVFVPTGGLKRGEIVAFGASTSFMKSSVREAINIRISNITDSRSNHDLFYVDSVPDEYKAAADMIYSKHYPAKKIPFLNEQSILERQLIANEKILRKHPNRKDLFLQNQELRKRIKELKRKKK